MLHESCFADTLFPRLFRRGDKDEGMKCVEEELNNNVIVLFYFESPDGTHLNLKVSDSLENAGRGT